MKNKQRNFVTDELDFRKKKNSTNDFTGQLRKTKNRHYFNPGLK